MQIVIASLNTNKIQELREGLKMLLPQLEVLSLFDFPQYKRPKVEEDSFEKSAAFKAQHAATELQKVCLADDSGIIVPQLGRRPYQHEVDSRSKETKKLLEEMRSFRDLERAAYLECSLALATPAALVKAVSQRTEGVLTEEERGKLTFEFDTIFMKHDYSKTLGELSPSVRSRISHRRKALEKILPALERLKWV